MCLCSSIKGVFLCVFITIFFFFSSLKRCVSRTEGSYLVVNNCIEFFIVLVKYIELKSETGFSWYGKWKQLLEIQVQLKKNK